MLEKHSPPSRTLGMPPSLPFICLTYSSWTGHLPSTSYPRSTQKASLRPHRASSPADSAYFMNPGQKWLKYDTAFRQEVEVDASINSSYATTHRNIFTGIPSPVQQIEEVAKGSCRSVNKQVLQNFCLASRRMENGHSSSFNNLIFSVSGDHFSESPSSKISQQILKL